MSFIKLVLILNSVSVSLSEVQSAIFSCSLLSLWTQTRLISTVCWVCPCDCETIGYTFHKILIKLQATFFNRSDPLTLSDCNSVIYQGLEYE